MLERRLDAVIYRSKIAPTIFAAKQLIKHKKVLVNGSVVSVASYLVAPDEVVSLKENVKNHQIVQESLTRQDREVPSYYEISNEGKEVKFLKVPSQDEVPYPFELNTSLIIEYYSRRT